MNSSKDSGSSDAIVRHYNESARVLIQCVGGRDAIVRHYNEPGLLSSHGL